MPTFELSKMVQASPEKLFSKILDFEYYSNYFPQIKNITIIEKSDTKIVTSTSPLMLLAKKYMKIHFLIFEHQYHLLMYKPLSRLQ